MKLSNFEKSIDPVILERGQAYYNNRFIESIDQFNSSHYIVKITGSKHYTVELKLAADLDTVKDISCDCPYNRGPYCKHIAAALYQLTEKETTTRHQESEVDAQVILESLDKAELVSMLLGLFKTYPFEKDTYLFKYSEETSNAVGPTYFKQKIDEVISSYVHPYQIIGYYDTMHLTDQLEDILDVIAEVKDVPPRF
ncbi:SWIM zinc finger domain-containing protein [Alkalibacterium sp. 20]|uniref:SWIM zinc finger family protein n=1 Tax=Alkalibacterium sp. 20 TaxID=1798803 RepID=UPI00090017CD|nr:SWIM zinc finger family protein [Alkalibacterium sp. 20]OJF94025.1 hypothetical protein AX762_08120 [Alkalibacterium sp. 20]